MDMAQEQQMMAWHRESSMTSGLDTNMLPPSHQTDMTSPPDFFHPSMDRNSTPMNPAGYYATSAAQAYRAPSYSGSQVCRTHPFHSSFHPWIADSTKSMMQHSSWMPPFSKPLSHPSPTGALSVAPSGSLGGTSSSHLFPFPPTPPKDGTPEVSSAGVQSAEYTPESKPNKTESPGAELASASSTTVGLSPGGYGTGFMSPGAAAHPMPSYPSYSEYGSTPLFHPATVLKAAAGLGRSRSKTRSSTATQWNSIAISDSLLDSRGARTWGGVPSVGDFDGISLDKRKDPNNNPKGFSLALPGSSAGTL